MQLMQENKVYNGAVLISKAGSGEILAYIGNTERDAEPHENDVDCILAPRSTGSILKPLLFSKALDAGLITPFSLLDDVPSSFGNFSPKNFKKAKQKTD